MKTAFLALSCATLLATGPALAGAMDLTVAEAVVIDAEGNELGTLSLTQTEEGVTIAGVLDGIPEGMHGFHYHETGVCDPATGFESAGGHLAPRGNQHGFEDPEGPHAGDMYNQAANADGQMDLNVNNDMVSLLDGEEGNLLDEDGSAVMIHANADDYSTDPGGDSGARIACGVIEPTEI
ncbi:MAG TPA: superoxide dismutase family protein [Devosia sp.]|jgi:Cu-Zn family superoxide dismutase|nr:superoxide dismutase family protein [Devosia sp.]